MDSNGTRDELEELNQIKDDVETSKQTKITFDDVLKELGQFGTYQKKIYFLLFVPTIFSAMHKLAWVFLGAKAPHRCRLPGEPWNSTYDQDGRNLSDLIPFKNKQYDQCNRFEDDERIIPCDNGWIYDMTTFGSSAIMEWNLVCNDLWMKATAQSLFMAGVLIGSYVFGEASDRLGRKPTFVASVIIQTVFGLVAGFLPEYWSYVLIRMVIGMTTSGVFLISYVLAMEMVGPKYRVIAGTLCQYYCTFGFFSTGLLAYFLNNNWRLLQIVISAPSVIFVVYWWIVPESVRWLMRKGRYEESKKIILMISEKNGTNVSEEMIANMFKTTNEEMKKEMNKSNLGVLDLFRHPNLRKNTLIMFYNWFVNSGTYYGLALSASDLGGDPYISFMISAAVEIPAYAIILLILNKFGRKIPLCLFMIIAGTSLIITILIDQSNSTVLITLSMIGKLAITTSYGVIYIFSTEIFPTSIRNVAVGACSMSARIGGILCPYLNMLVDYWRPLPLIVYGVFALSGGLLSLMLPETLNKKLPETLEDVENLGNESREEKA